MSTHLLYAKCRVPGCHWRATEPVADSEQAAALFEEHYEAEHQDVQAAIRRHPAKGA
jgi:hypothetical protein